MNSCTEKIKRFEFRFREKYLHNLHTEIRKARLHFLQILIYLCITRNAINNSQRKIKNELCARLSSQILLSSLEKIDGLSVLLAIYAVSNDAFSWNESSLLWFSNDRSLYAQRIPIHMDFGLFTSSFIRRSVMNLFTQMINHRCGKIKWVFAFENPLHVIMRVSRVVDFLLGICLWWSFDVIQSHYRRTESHYKSKSFMFA